MITLIHGNDSFKIDEFITDNYKRDLDYELSYANEFNTFSDINLYSETNLMGEQKKFILYDLFQNTKKNLIEKTLDHIVQNNIDIILVEHATIPSNSNYLNILKQSKSKIILFTKPRYVEELQRDIFEFIDEVLNNLKIKHNSQTKFKIFKKFGSNKFLIMNELKKIKNITDDLNDFEYFDKYFISTYEGIIFELSDLFFSKFSESNKLIFYINHYLVDISIFPSLIGILSKKISDIIKKNSVNSKSYILRYKQLLEMDRLMKTTNIDGKILILDFYLDMQLQAK